jgi:hypothetical protein
MDYRVADLPDTLLVLFALVFFRWLYAVVHGVGMKHYRDEVEKKETEAPASGSERCQQHEDSDRDRTKHPQKAGELVSLVDMSKAGNDTKNHCHSVTCLAFCRLGRPQRPITSVTPLGIFRQRMPAVWAVHFISSARFRPSGWCVRVLYAHFEH